MKNNARQKSNINQPANRHEANGRAIMIQAIITLDKKYVISILCFIFLYLLLILISILYHYLFELNSRLNFGSVIFNFILDLLVRTVG